MNSKKYMTQKFLAFVFIVMGLTLVLSNTSAQKFWLTTYEFPGGAKTSITLARDSCIFVSVEKGILRSCNDGKSFEPVLNKYAIYTIFSTKNGLLLAGSPGKIYSSSDLGQTWDSIASGANYSVIQFIENKNGDLFGITGDVDFDQGSVGDGILFSGDGGKNWALRNNGLGTFKSCERIAIDKNDRLYLTMADDRINGDGGLFISDDNGNNWEHINITIDGKNAITDQLQVGNAFGLSVSPEDSVYYSFSGRADNVEVTINIGKKIADIKSNSFWKVYKISDSNHWWNDRILNNIHFAKNGDWYSSTIGTYTTGATYFSKNYVRKWEKIDYGLGLDMMYQRNIQYFVENLNGTIFMVQFLDERVYKTDTSVITKVEPILLPSTEIQVYPNPIQKGEEFSVQITNNSSGWTLSIYDFTGKKIMSNNGYQKNIKLTAPKKPGFYFIVLESKTSKSTARFVVSTN